MKYMIHSCNQRQWYVDQYLYPSLLKQGIPKEDISVYPDVNKLGNLEAFIHSTERSFIADSPEEFTWHLQDDVIISSHFREESLRHTEYDIVCGFICQYDEGRKPGVGIASKDMWYSFPCIKIKNTLLLEFAEWIRFEINRGSLFVQMWVRQKKGDDFVFRTFLEIQHPNLPILNLAPNIVDHIDYILGGSIVNRTRGSSDVRSIYWEEPELVKTLEKEILHKNNVVI